LSALLCRALFVCLAVLRARLVWDDYRYGEVSPGIGLPQWWYSIWLPALSLVIALRLFGVWLRLRKQT
ncbi:MAG: TRAP transporter small permease, partial [Burkholderiaceae bacterium]|nr:TRAP transporter small permease [Burkholderiaceae bacterium]